MSVPQDVGGKPGFGPVKPETDEPTFHAGWEKRTLGLVLGAGAWGAWSIDEGRSARELIPAPIYYASSYYEVWTMGLETLAKRHGFLSERDLTAGHAVDPAAKPRRVLKPADVPATLARGGPSNRPLARLARFKAGDRVRTSKADPPHHTRLPSYARGKVGVIETVHEPHVFPDSNAQRLGEAQQWLYTVTFGAPELFGASADPTSTVSIDAWESYLSRPEAPPGTEPVFAEPWQASAFALTVALHERGLFSWTEWAKALGEEVKLGDDYYAAWLRALEALLRRKGVAGTAEINDLAASWRRAAQATPHGKPILLQNDPERARRP